MIGGSLLVTVGYQIIFFGFFTNIYERRGLPKFFTLEKGATIGAFLILIGLVYVVSLFIGWVTSGFRQLPSVQQDILGFTAIVLGLQTFFSSFMLSIIIGKR